MYAGNKNINLPQRARYSNRALVTAPTLFNSPTAAIYNTTTVLGATESPNTTGTNIFPPVRTENLFVQWW